MNKTQIKSLHLNTAHTWRGGEAQVLELIKRLKKHGHHTLLVAQPSSPLTQKAKQTNIPVKELKMRGEWDFISTLLLAKIIKTFAPDIVHAHTAHAHTIALLATKIAKQGKLVVARRVDFPIKKNILSSWKYSNNVTYFITVSNAIKKVLINAGIPETKISTVYSGIDLNKFTSIKVAKQKLYQEFYLQKDDFIIGNIAALATHKDQSILIKAAAKIIKINPNVKFLIVGEGELENKLKNECTKLNLTNHVIFTGFRKDIGEILQILDVFVLSSYLEGLGTSLLDAMLCSLPIVATKVGGIPEAVIDGENGILVAEKNPQQLAEAITKLAINEKLRKQMGKKGRELVEKFNIENTVIETEKVYKKILGIEHK